MPGVRLVSLQRGVPSGALACERIQFPLTDLGDDVDKEGGAFMDKAAIMRNLDLVIVKPQ
jgi:hypothetical protein